MTKDNKINLILIKNLKSENKIKYIPLYIQKKKDRKLVINQITTL